MSDADDKDHKARVQAYKAKEHVSKKRPILTRPFGRVSLQRPDGEQVYIDLDALRGALLVKRHADMGGFPSYKGEGQWGFVSCLIEVGPELLNSLLALAGITPDEVIQRGRCETCRWSDNGRHRGWDAPCCGCASPYMSRYAPKRKGKRR